MIAIDTNLLVYAHRGGAPEHSEARTAIESAASKPGGWGIAVASVAEFWSVVTHPAAAGRPSSSAEARGFLLALVEGGAALWSPGPSFARRLLQVAADSEVSGARVFDLQIALTAFDNGAVEIWTHDRNFTTVPGLAVVHPLA